MDIKNKIAVITGGASGIGKAMAARFMQEGAAHVIIADVNPALEEVAEELGVTAIKTDVSKEAEVQHLIRTAESNHGQIDLLCNNAGIGVGGGPETANAVTKHAAVAYAEWLAVTYGDRGIKVSALCPQAVRTAMTANTKNGGVAGIDGMMEPEQLCDSVMETMKSEKFLILPHPEVLTYMQRKTTDYDRWISGMKRLQAQFGRDSM